MFWRTVPTDGAAMPRSTAVPAARLVSVNVVPSRPPRPVRHLSHPWIFLVDMASLPRRPTRCRNPSLLLPTPPPLLRLCSLELRLRPLHFQARQRRPLLSSQRNQLLLCTHRQPRLSLLTSQLHLLPLRPWVLLPRLLHPLRTHLPPLLTVVPHLLQPRVVAVLKARVDHTSRPSQATVPRVPAGRVRTNGFPSRLCGRSTKTS